MRSGDAREQDADAAAEQNGAAGNGFLAFRIMGVKARHLRLHQNAAVELTERHTE